MATLELAGLLHLTILPLSLLAMSLTSTVDPLETDFSSNAHTPNPNLGAFAPDKSTEFEIPSRHPDLCFVDGSVALLCGHQYFLVHHSLLSLHSPILKQMVEASVKEQTCHVMEGRPTARILQSPGDMLVYLKAIYGLYRPKDLASFNISSTLLRLTTAYDTVKIRNEVLRSLQESWPSRLDQWEVREKNATDSDGVYAPRTTMAHPILIIKLAREVNAPELLPSAFYDLSRFLPSQLSAGYTDPDTGEVHYLTQEDLFRVFRGKEQAARYFSTFIVKELEGRTPSEFCHNRNELNPGKKRRCQVAYEAVTYALIRDVNGLVLNRNSDPLYAISDSLLMQTRDDMPGADNRSTHRACEACRMEYAAVVEAIREEFWRRLPEWFDLEVSNWG